MRNAFVFAGMFDGTHMTYKLEAEATNDESNPTLAEMAEKAIRMLSNGDSGYFLLVEGTLW